MVQVKINLPEEVLNKLNNYYLQNFGYEIHTQLINFLMEDIEKSMEYPISKVAAPLPTIHNFKDKTRFEVIHPDGTKMNSYLNKWEDALKLWNEWSKYGFDAKKRDVALFKAEPSRVDCITKKGGKYLVENSHQGYIFFGEFENIEDAVKVKQFLKKHAWNRRYSLRNIIKKYSEINQDNYAEYMLSLAEEEGF